MAYRAVIFGATRASLLTVGYKIKASDGTYGSRITAGVAEEGTATGIYGATVTETGDPLGILWDSGEATPAYAFESLRLEPTGGTVSTVTGTVTSTGPNYITIPPGYANGSITIRRGDSYGTTSGQRITITKPTGASWPSDLASVPWTVTFTVTKVSKGDGTAAHSLGPIACTINSATSVDVPMTAAQTALFTAHLRATDDANGWAWDLQAENGTLRNTLVSGLMTVLPQLTTG